MFLEDPYAAKAFEYLLGLTFLMCFAGFWRYATGSVGVDTVRGRAALEPAIETAVEPIVAAETDAAAREERAS